MNFIHQFILELLTSFLTVHSTDDLEVDLGHLRERWDWSITAYRSYLSFPVAGNNYTIVCTLAFLAITQGMHLLYNQLATEQLQTLVDMVGPRTFTTAAAVPSLGVITIPIMQILLVSRSPITALSLILVIVVPAIILPLAMLCFARVQMQQSDDSQA
ncbi:hypothetical protein EDD16DRAFT_1630645 [Pisolithus croceorrhizus]|nr:hypothetical protein EDD16DRAFT_1630645 [Pisolithus croceorrhizus]KAI6107427.1 hypothetical protein EV401DRAFT_2002761 [Pisolithus croceorrhizus]KAI6142910.1 hypothetical protein EDD17DRAFT_1660883 [Pisolithus thermaeus]